MRKFEYIDALRGIAVLGVFLVHTTDYGPENDYSGIIEKIFLFGVRGVQLFFVASAFTLF